MRRNEVPLVLLETSGASPVVLAFVRSAMMYYLYERLGGHPPPGIEDEQIEDEQNTDQQTEEMRKMKDERCYKARL